MARPPKSKLSKDLEHLLLISCDIHPVLANVFYSMPKFVNIMMALEEKSGYDQSQKDYFYWEYKYLYNRTRRFMGMQTKM